MRFNVDGVAMQGLRPLARALQGTRPRRQGLPDTNTDIGNDKENEDITSEPDMNTFGHGVICMARNCLPALDLIDSGQWTIADMRRWLNAMISNDAEYLEEVKEKMRGNKS